MDLKQIRYFLEVVDQGSINMAAHKLGMTQPPVSKQMQLLEQELGCELFRRSSRPLELTPEGKVLYERGSALLAMAQGMVQAVADCRNTQGGTLRLGLVSSVSELAVQRWIAPFGQMHPGVDFALYESNTYSLLERLRRRVIGPLSTPEEVRQQEQLLDDVLAAVSTTADRHPGLRADEAYSRLFGTSDCCEQMLRTSRLLYNDAVTRLDRAVRSFPTSWVARLCGVKRRQHWEA